MSVRICLCSDNHGNVEALDRIKSDNPCCDYYFHLGDSLMSDKMLLPFVSVEGNCDYGMQFPYKRIVEINNHRILLMHGDGYTYSISGLTNKAKIEKCDVIMFGHTHEFLDEEYKGVRLINPGSCSHNRYEKNPSYAIVNIDENGTIIVEKKVL